MEDRSPKKILAENIRALRQKIGISQEELAGRSGLHRTYISSVEREERNLSLENIFKIARALAVSPGSLLEEKKVD